MMTINWTARATLVAAILALWPAAAAQAAEGGAHIERQKWSFAGFTGKFDQAQLQRGYQVYKDVCAVCHGMQRIAFRNLAEKGGPGFPEPSVKALAATFKVDDEPNDQGKILQRPAKPSDAFPSPFRNEKEARTIHNGAYPPDLSNMAKARAVETAAPWYSHIFLMLRDMAYGYQEGGPDYIYALLTSYADKPPAGMKDSEGKPFKMSDGMHFNNAFPGHQIAMVAPLSDGLVKYQDGTPAKVDNYARDVTAFMAWAADPSLESRKSMGWIVMLYLLITALLLYVAKRRTWAKMH